MIRNSLLGGLCVALLAACSTAPLHTSTPPAPAPKTAADAILQEAWVSEPVPGDELDSLVAWPTEDGRVWLIATAKATHHLALYDADTGQRLRTVGGPGTAVGQFNRPNGIAVFGDLLFVAERDNHRVQAFRLPEFAPLGAFGADVLRSPYGLWVHEPAPGVLELFVTDSFMADFANRVLPAPQRLAERVKRYRVAERDGKLEVRYLGAFGDTGEDGALRMVESIAGDIAHDRLLIADEDRRVGSTLREYSLDGRFQGRSLPPFRSDAEGVVLWVCGQDGYWIAADQLDPTRFRVFERDSLAPAGAFSGARTANTDGVALAGASARFPHGVLYALHDDTAVAAFDLGQVAQQLQLAPACGS